MQRGRGLKKDHPLSNVDRWNTRERYLRNPVGGAIDESGGGAGKTLRERFQRPGSLLSDNGSRRNLGPALARGCKRGPNVKEVNRGKGSSSVLLDARFANGRKKQKKCGGHLQGKGGKYFFEKLGGKPTALGRKRRLFLGHY